MRIPNAVWVAFTVLLLLIFAGGAAVSEVLPSTQPNSGNIRAWGGMVIKEVDCDKGSLALVDESPIHSKARNPELWNVVIIAEDLKGSVITREGLKGSLVCNDLKPFQLVTFTGEVKLSERNHLVVSAKLVRVDRENVFDAHEKTQVIPAVINMVTENFLVTTGGLEVGFRHPLVIETREHGFWVTKPLLPEQLSKGMPILLYVTERPDEAKVFTRQIATRD